MPIQFCCTNCQQPIEVDDEHAGQNAACPYCSRIVAVPAQSTYDPHTALLARPAAGSPPPPAGAESAAPGISSGELPAHAAPPPFYSNPELVARQRAAATFGKYALICAALAVGLFAIVTVSAIPALMKSGALTPGAPLSRTEMLKRAEAVQRPWMAALSYGSLFFALAGLSLGIVSLVQSRRGNWRGLTALGICGLFLFCICIGNLFAAFMMGVGGA